jgi:hypothetical protein
MRLEKPSSKDPFDSFRSSGRYRLIKPATSLEIDNDVALRLGAADQCGMPTFTDSSVGISLPSATRTYRAQLLRPGL